MVSKISQRTAGRAESLYEHLLSIADPETGKVAISGPQAGAAIGCGAAAARMYMGQLILEGKVAQLSETKTGTPTLYRIPAFSKGDVRTTYEAPKQPEPPSPYYSAERTLATREKRLHENSVPSPREIAETALAGQENLMSKILLGYMDMYRALEEIAKG